MSVNLFVISFVFAYFLVSSLSNNEEALDCNAFWMQIQKLYSTPYAFFVLTGTVDPHIFHWTTFLPKHEFTIFFIEDAVNEEAIIPFEKAYPMQGIESSPRRYIVHLDSKVLNDKGYGGMNFVKGWISAWEKAMYFLIELKPTYEYMWFMEDDVLVLLPEAFLNIHKQLVDRKVDLSGNKYDSGHPSKPQDWYNWHRIKTMQQVYPSPFYRGMACSVGISKRMLQKIAWFRSQVNRFEFLEVLFYTIAKKENLTIHTPVALQEVRWRKEHDCYEVISLKKFWYHPVKHQAEFIRRCIDSRIWKSELAKYQTPQLRSPNRIAIKPPPLGGCKDSKSGLTTISNTLCLAIMAIIPRTLL